MIALHYPLYKHLFITYGKIGSSTLAGLPSPNIHYDKKISVLEDFTNNNFLDHEIVLMLRNPRDRFRAGLFTTLFFEGGIRNKTMEEWVDILTEYLSNTGMFNANPTSWEQYHCMPWLQNIETFVDSIRYTPVHISRLSDYLADHGIEPKHENNTDRYNEKSIFYNAYSIAIKQFQKEYNLLLARDVKLYNLWLTGEYV